MKTHQELRWMAADYEFNRLVRQGRDVIIGRMPDQSATNPNHPNNVIPVILDRAEVERYEREKLTDPHTPRPIPVVSFAVWTYKARCPLCEVAQIQVVLDPDGSGNGPTPDSPAKCLRTGCGWTGLNSEVLRTCLHCGALVPGVIDAACPQCQRREQERAGAAGSGPGGGASGPGGASAG